MAGTGDRHRTERVIGLAGTGTRRAPVFSATVQRPGGRGICMRAVSARSFRSRPPALFSWEGAAPLEGQRRRAGFDHRPRECHRPRRARSSRRAQCASRRSPVEGSACSPAGSKWPPRDAWPKYTSTIGHPTSRRVIPRPVRPPAFGDARGRARHRRDPRASRRSRRTSRRSRRTSAASSRMAGSSR